MQHITSSMRIAQKFIKNNRTVYRMGVVFLAVMSNSLKQIQIESIRRFLVCSPFTEKLVDFLSC